MRQVGVMGEGLYPVLQRAPSSPHSGAGSGQRAAGWCWEDGGVSERDELLERLREAVFLPQPRDGSLCRYSTVLTFSSLSPGCQLSILIAAIELSLKPPSFFPRTSYLCYIQFAGTGKPNI